MRQVAVGCCSAVLPPGVAFGRGGRVVIGGECRPAATASRLCVSRTRLIRWEKSRRSTLRPLTHRSRERPRTMIGPRRVGWCSRRDSNCDTRFKEFDPSAAQWRYCTIGSTAPSRARVPTSGAVDVSCGCQPELALLADPALLLPGFLLLALGHTVRGPRSLMNRAPGSSCHHLPLTRPSCLGRRTTLRHAASPSGLVTQYVRL
jgi:hypothetical protein